MKGKRNRDHSTLRLSFSYNAPGGVRVSTLREVCQANIRNI